MSEVSFESEVWKTLSTVDCSKHVEKKQNLSYLSWAWAWAILMNNYPQSEFAFDEPKEYPDGTQEVWVTVTIRSGDKATERRMWLPCLDHRNQPIKSPNAFQINTTRMRCLTKCLAMFGLGHHIYAGEDIPRPELDAPAVGEKKDRRAVTAALEGVVFDEEQRGQYVHALQVAVDREDDLGLGELLDELRTDSDMKLAVWQKLNSVERRYIKTFEEARQAA